MNEDGLASLLNTYEKSPHFEVEVKKFDDIFRNENIDLIKMDVEGSEIRIIRGMLQYLHDHKNVEIIMEWNPTYRNEEDFIFISKIFDVYYMLYNNNKTILIKIKDYENVSFAFFNMILKPKTVDSN